MKANVRIYSGRRCAWLLTAMVAVGLTVSLWPAPGRADDIDEKLYKTYAPQIMRDLKEHGYKNVAILKFQVKKPSADKASLMVGRLNTGMATRLENALILEVDEQRPLGITRGASQAAAKKNVQATYLHEAGVKNLLNTKYPLAWGNKEVAVDALLTGIVAISRDCKETTITVQAFDKKHTAKPRDIVSFKAKTDRALLSDINQNFVITKRQLKEMGKDGSVTTDELNQAANDDAANNLANNKAGNNKAGNNKAGNNKAGNNKAGNNTGSLNKNTQGSLARVREYVDFKIMINNLEVQVGPDDRIPTPSERQEVTFLVKNLKPFPVGVVLRINGLNTINNERDNRTPEEYSCWVLKPAAENANKNRDGYFHIRGFYPNLKTRQPIVAMPDAEVNQDTQLGEDVQRHGFIHFDILEPMDREEPGVQLRERKVVSFRGVTKRGANLASLKNQVQKSIFTKEKPRTLLVPDATSKDANLREETFQGSWVVGCSIGYQGGMTENGGGNNNPGNNNNQNRKEDEKEPKNP